MQIRSLTYKSDTASYAARVGGLPGLSTQDATAVLEVAQELAAQQTRADRVQVAAQRLLELLDGEVCGYNRIDLRAGHADVDFYPSVVPLASVGPEAMQDHPLIHHFMGTTDRLPRRVSEVASRQQWLGSNAYGQVLAPLGTSNVLAIPVRFSATAAEAYAVARGGRDFSDRDCSVAAAIQIALVAVHPPQEPAQTLPTLTRREHEVLVLLSQGCSAQTISHRLLISPRTVRKHLEHVYAKLGAQDRLTAVNCARAAELI